MSNSHPTKLVILSAPSGAGKTTLCQRLIQTFPDRLLLSLSTTTRDPRGGEVHGNDYFFCGDGEFKKLIDQGDFAEWALVHGHYYGTRTSTIQEAFNKGLSVVLDIDVQGASSLRQTFPDQSLLIFIAPPSLEELRNRLVSRGTDSEEIIEKRLRSAAQEMNAAKNFDFHIVNDDLENAFDQLKTIVSREVFGQSLG